MIIRKPYAFLIKNFKKIHIFLLIVSLYVGYKLFSVSGFVSEFMSLGTYDAYNDPVTKYISFLVMVSVFLLVVGSGALLLLLRHKKKPWKVYLVPFVEYLALFFVLNMIKSFFAGYTNDIETTDLRMSRDLLYIFILIQLPAIGIYAMRVFGLDVAKFNFNSDKEFLELSEEDREEIEISISVDKHSFKRVFKRLLRNLNYIYTEHRGLCRTIITIIVFVFSYKVYNNFTDSYKSYSEGDVYYANGYTMKINKSYLTNKDNVGNVISLQSNFLIVDVTITNNASSRIVNVDNFHIKSGVSDFVSTKKTYAKEFEDLGSTYDGTKELARGETLNMILVYKVDKKIKKDRFILYYQELDQNSKLRKIKLNVQDVSVIEDAVELDIGDTLKIDIVGKQDNVSFDDYEILDNTTYITRKCTTLGCESTTNDFSVEEGFKIMKISFGSENYETKNMIDFLTKYGKIIYKDSKGSSRTLRFEDAIRKDYFGKSLFVKVPKDVETSTEVGLLITIRNKSYSYKLT